MLHRIIYLIPGLLYKIFSLSIEGSRDINNKIRYRNSKIFPKCRINKLTKINKNCHILDNVLINNSDIESYSYIGSNSILQNVIIGKFCSIANDVFIGLGTHPSTLFSTSPLFYRKKNKFKIELVETDLKFEEYRKITIGNDVWIGTRAIIIDGTNIGDGVITAANSVVTKDIPPYAIVAGVPAKIIRFRFSDEKIKKLLDLEWWNWSLEKIKEHQNKLNE